jgi:hypothetical protein
MSLFTIPAPTAYRAIVEFMRIAGKTDVEIQAVVIPQQRAEFPQIAGEPIGSLVISPAPGLVLAWRRP